MTLNQMQLIGNLGGDPEMRYTPEGNAVTSFSVAVNNNYKRRDGSQVDETDWFRISVWGNQADACNTYLEKGKKVYVSGRLKSNTFQRQDGTQGFSMEINADRVVFLSSRQDAAAAPDAPPQDADKLPW